VSEEYAKRIFRELQTLARADYGGNTGALLVVYAAEGFLRRLSASEYATKMTLKGGMLMAAMSARRMTRDADLSAVGVSNEQSQVAAIVAAIASVTLASHDGLSFDPTTIVTEAMRENAEYHGVRAKLVAHLATARTTTTLDFSFGDLQRSTVIELPELLGEGTIRLACYPPEMTLAEKIATMMSRGAQHARQGLRRRLGPQPCADHHRTVAAHGDHRRRRAPQARCRPARRGARPHARPSGLLYGDVGSHGLPARPAAFLARPSC
jgi:Nucleotidyl transferase AbiEii toxin, Type IV TA system